MEDTLTVTRLNALMREWEKHPPVPLMLAAFLGIESKEQHSAQECAEMLHALSPHSND